MVTSDYVIVSIKLSPEVGNDEFIIVCNFGGRGMSDLKVMEGRGLRALPSHRKQKKLGLNWFNTEAWCASETAQIIFYKLDFLTYDQ